MKRLRYIGLVLMTALTYAHCGSAQVSLQVVTKTIERSFEYDRGDYVMLKGNKSNIEVVGWDVPTVKVEIKLTSKARTKAIAEKELEFQRYILEKRKEEIGITNYYSYPYKDYKLESILLASYKIWVPKAAVLQITNEYGNITMKDLQGTYVLDNRFGNLTLENVSGKGTYNSYFGDCHISNLSGEQELIFSKTKTIISGLSGSAEIKSNLGDLSIIGISTLLQLNVEAVKADVSLELGEDWRYYDLYFKSDFGEVIVDPSMMLEAAISDSGDLYILKRKGQPGIRATTSFGKITILK